jgi:hypothetical protein
VYNSFRSPSTGNLKKRGGKASFFISNNDIVSVFLVGKNFQAAAAVGVL